MTLQPPEPTQWHVEFADGHTCTVKANTEQEAISYATALWADQGPDGPPPPAYATPVDGIPIHVDANLGDLHYATTYVATPNLILGDGNPNPQIGACPQCGVTIKARQSFYLIDRTIFCSEECGWIWVTAHGREGAQ